jgi:uncharacterized membrane protein YphA (DoxX/SURF4 family)
MPHGHTSKYKRAKKEPLVSKKSLVRKASIAISGGFKIVSRDFPIVVDEWFEKLRAEKKKQEATEKKQEAAEKKQEAAEKQRIAKQEAAATAKNKVLTAVAALKAVDQKIQDEVKGESQDASLKPEGQNLERDRQEALLDFVVAICNLEPEKKATDSVIDVFQFRPYAIMTVVGGILIAAGFTASGVALIAVPVLALAAIAFLIHRCEKKQSEKTTGLLANSQSSTGSLADSKSSTLFGSSGDSIETGSSSKGNNESNSRGDNTAASILTHKMGSVTA